MPIDTKTLSDFRRDFEKVIEELEVQYDLKISIGKIHFDRAHFTCKMQAWSINPDDEESTKEREEWNRYCCKFNLRPSHYGRTVELNNGQTMTIVGLNTRARKAPIILKDEFGKTWKAPVSVLHFPEFDFMNL